MSIATKTGDKGKTSLFSGERVNKDNPRVEAYGTVDELNSLIGDAKHYCESEGFFEILESIQSDLFKICTELSSTSGKIGNLIDENFVNNISSLLIGFEKNVKLEGFVIPGNSPGSAKLDICRTVARRSERRIVTVNGNNNLNEFILKYINRLSDLLFIMARVEEKRYKKCKNKT